MPEKVERTINPELVDNVLKVIQNQKTDKKGDDTQRYAIEPIEKPIDEKEKENDYYYGYGY